MKPIAFCEFDNAMLFLDKIPILSSAESSTLESQKLRGNPQRIWSLLQLVGSLAADQFLKDFKELGSLPPCLHGLVLFGKGHNAADALMTLISLQKKVNLSLHLIGIFPKKDLKHLTFRALCHLQNLRNVKIEAIFLPDNGPQPWEMLGKRRFDFCFDGIFGLGARLPLDQSLDHLIQWVNQLDIPFRIAFDLPTGLGDNNESTTLFNANFTYVPGIPKQMLFATQNIDKIGRVRFLDLGFFESEDNTHPKKNRPKLLTKNSLKPLQNLRAANSDKRSFGHLLVVGGSRAMPGALAMASEAALHAGVGLLTVATLDSVAAELSGRIPEAMWLRSSDKECLTPAFVPFLIKNLPRGLSAVLIGPGLGKSEKNLHFVCELVNQLPEKIPLVLDADALRPEVLTLLIRSGKVILTPHFGEWLRLLRQGQSGQPKNPQEKLKTFSRKYNVITVLKRPLTYLSDGSQMFISPFGGPLLARGGTGDVLSGLLAGLLAEKPKEALEVACQAVVWHGCAADSLAYSQGQRCVRTTDIFKKLGCVLRKGEAQEVFSKPLTPSMS